MKKEASILKLVDKYQYKAAICYPKTNERIYCNLRIFYILSFIYQTVFSLLLILGFIFIPASTGMYLQNTIIATVSYTAALVLMCFKRDLIGLFFNIFATVYKMTVISPLLLFRDGVWDVSPTFYWQHLIPVVLLFIASVWMSIISTRQRYLINRDYKKVLNGIYSQYGEKFTDLTDDEWQQFIRNFKPEESDRRQKRSVKQSRRKQAERDSSAEK